MQALANDQTPLTIQKVCQQYLVKPHFQGFFLWLKICKNDNKIMSKVTANNDDDDDDNSSYGKSFIIRE
jgi:hypothetical protein